MELKKKIEITNEIKEIIRMLLHEIDKKDLEIARLEKIIKYYDREWENESRH